MVRPTDQRPHPIVTPVDKSSDDPAGALSSPEAVVLSYLASFSDRDLTAIAAHVADDFVNDHTAALGSGCVGRAEYASHLPSFLADMIDLRYTVEDLLVDSTQVAAFYTMTARWHGDTPITVRGVQRLVVHDGLITHRTDYWDSAVFLRQASAEARAALAPFGI